MNRSSQKPSRWGHKVNIDTDGRLVDRVHREYRATIQKISIFANRGGIHPGLCRFHRAKINRPAFHGHTADVRAAAPRAPQESRS